MYREFKHISESNIEITYQYYSIPTWQIEAAERIQNKAIDWQISRRKNIYWIDQLEWAVSISKTLILKEENKIDRSYFMWINRKGKSPFFVYNLSGPVVMLAWFFISVFKL